MQNDKLVYDVSDIQKLLGLSRNSTYSWLSAVYKVQSPFKVLKIGKLYKVPKSSFDKWIENC